MARQPESPLVSVLRNLETFDAHAWDRQWWQDRTAHPVYLKVEMPARLHAGARLSVIAFTDPHPGRAQAGQWHLGLVGETLTAALAARLEKALLAIKHLEGLDFAHGVALLVQHYLYDVDQDKAAHLRAPSFFTAALWESLQGTPPERFCLIEDIKNHPRWELSALLDFYRTALEARTFLGFGASRNGRPGFPDYRRIPPGWIPLDTAFHRAPGQPTTLAALTVDAATHNEGRPGNVAQHAPQGTQACFAHSPDFRSVSYRGDSFSLTSQQAHVFEILHQAYTQGTPDVSEAFMLEELRCRSSRLRDSFRSTPGVWNKLIVSQRKGSYRLQI